MSMRKRTTGLAAAAALIGLAGGTTLALWREADATALGLQGAGWALVVHDGETDDDDPVIASNPENVTRYVVTGAGMVDELNADGSAYVGIDVDGWLAGGGSLAYEIGVTSGGTGPLLDVDVTVRRIGADETCAYGGFDASREPVYDGSLSAWAAQDNPLVTPDNASRQHRDRYCLVLHVEPEQYENTASATGGVGDTDVTVADKWSATFFDIDRNAAAAVTFLPYVSRTAPAPAP